MRGTLLRQIKMSAVTIALCLSFALRSFSQVRTEMDDWCATLHNASSPDLVQFLNAVVPDEKNSHCVTWTIRKLAKEHYELAITTLVRFLDFRRPLTQREKVGLPEPGGIAGIWSVYPAVGALDAMGKAPTEAAKITLTVTTRMLLSTRASNSPPSQYLTFHPRNKRSLRTPHGLHSNRRLALTT